MDVIVTFTVDRTLLEILHCAFVLLHVMRNLRQENKKRSLR